MRKCAWACLFLAVAVVCFAASERQRITYRDFSGGINFSADPDAVGQNQLKKAYNCVIENDRSIRARPGFYFKNTIPTSVVATASYITALEPNNKEFAYIDYSGKAFVTKNLDSGFGVNIYTPTNPDSRYASFARLGDWMVFGAEGDYLQYYYVASASLASSTSVPGPQETSGILIAHNDRIFNSNKSALYETSVGSATDFTGGEAWAIGEDSEGDITGLGNIGVDLYIFKTNSIYRMSGYSPSERYVELVTKNYGTKNPKSIVSADLTGIGRCILFLSSTAKICVLTPSGVFPISEAIQDALDAGLLGYDYRNCSACYEAERNSVIFVFGIGSGGWLEGHGLYLNGNVSYQSPYGLRWPFTVYGNPDFYRSSRFWFVGKNANVNSGDYQSQNQIAAIMTTTNLAQAERVICRQWLLQPEYIARDNNTGPTAQFPITIQTRDESAGDDRIWKGWRLATISGFHKYGGSAEVGTFTQIISSTVVATTSAAIPPGTTYQSIKVPLFNFSQRMSINIEMLLYNAFCIKEIAIDLVKGPKLE